ncbi:MAG: hypothetical protein N3A58_03510, partial [Spirochaetes bacterium]|nr:hypothetical protein [Spirochaetota bacterium]
YEILPFINLNSGLRYNETDLKSINEKTNFNTKKIIKIIDLSLFFSFIPMNLDNFINDNNIDAIYIDLSKSFGIPINYIIFYFKSLNIFDCKIIFQKFDDVNVKISIISMIKFFKKFGVYKLINLTTRNYYFIYNKLNEIANSSIHNNKIKFKLNQIPSNYSKYNKDYLRKFPSFLIPIEFESDKLASEIYNKLLENKIFTELYKNFIIISPSFYNTLEDFNLFLDTLKEI